MIKKQSHEQSSAKKRNRLRALPLPNAIAWTIADFQALGGPGKTSIYALAKSGRLKLFVDGAGRTMVDGESGRALLADADEVA